MSDTRHVYRDKDNNVVEIHFGNFDKSQYREEMKVFDIMTKKEVKLTAEELALASKNKQVEVLKVLIPKARSKKTTAPNLPLKRKAAEQNASQAKKQKTNNKETFFRPILPKNIIDLTTESKPTSNPPELLETSSDLLNFLKKAYPEKPVKITPERLISMIVINEGNSNRDTTEINNNINYNNTTPHQYPAVPDEIPSEINNNINYNNVSPHQYDEAHNEISIEINNNINYNNATPDQYPSTPNEISNNYNYNNFIPPLTPTYASIAEYDGAMIFTSDFDAAIDQAVESFHMENRANHSPASYHGLFTQQDTPSSLNNNWDNEENPNPGFKS